MVLETWKDIVGLEAPAGSISYLLLREVGGQRCSSSRLVRRGKSELTF